MNQIKPCKCGRIPNVTIMHVGESRGPTANFKAHQVTVECVACVDSVVGGQFVQFPSALNYAANLWNNREVIDWR